MSFLEKNKANIIRIMIVILMVVITACYVERIRTTCAVYGCENKKASDFQYCHIHVCANDSCGFRNKSKRLYCHLHACPVESCLSSSNCSTHVHHECIVENCNRYVQKSISSFYCGYCHAPGCNKEANTWPHDYCIDHTCIADECDDMKVQGSYFCKRHQYYIYNIEDKK